MSSLKYWEHRQAERMFEYMQSAEDTADEISKLYQKASRYISHELDRIFERYKRKHHLTDVEAYRLLNTLRDKASLDELKQALKAPGRGQTAADLLAELESPAYQARLERLQQLQNQIDLAMQEIYNQEKVRNTSHYVDLANEAYYKSIFDIQQRTGVGFSFSLIDPKVIETVINSKWSGENYSKRIWNNTQALAKDLKQELLVSLITGRTDRETADIIANKHAQGASNARRLVRTESCNLANQMEMLSYEECGIETYIYVATLDFKTSEECRRLDGKRFPVAEQQPGKNCPPLHPWCRSTTICDISAEELAQMKRRARDPETGKTITVPADMTYDEWKKKYVDKQEESQKRYADRREERKQQYAKWQEEKNERLAEYSLDEENQKRYGIKAREWKRARFKTGGMNSHEYVQSKRPLANFRALPKEKVVDVLREDSKRWIEKLSEAEKHAIQKYTYNSGDKKPNRFFERLNAMLRGEKPKDEKLEQYSATISKALMKNKLDHDIICYRNMDFNPYKDYPVGKVICAEQFISTSVSKNAALQKKVEMVFFVHKDACGAYIESISKYPKQREFLLDKSCRLRVISNQEGRIILEVL